ncbi:MAG: HAD family hydrolase [Kurthia sp.]|nr:HAD family hydrolase [Candidatus Kurthia equi]
MFEAIIFDVDGTIIDTELAMLNSLQRTLHEEKQQLVTHDEIKFILGIPGKDALRMMNLEPVDELHQIWSNAVLDFFQDVNVFEGMYETLDKLKKKGIKLAIVTSKTKESMKDEFAPFQLNHLFVDMIDADDTDEHKPHPKPLLTSLEHLNLTANQAIYIGDSIYDMQSAHAAGMKFALAFWGAKKTEEFEAADYILKEPADLLNLVE